MSTRSRIGLELPSGQVRSIYCHNDGYPTGVGRVLSEHYIKVKKINSLLNLGDISSLGPEIGEQHDFEDWKKHPDWVRAYARDRGETNVDARLDANENECRSNDDWDINYHYLFTKGKWFVTTDEGFTPLERVLETS
jgi:hypothetical protein